MSINRSRPRWGAVAAVGIACSALLAPAIAQAASASPARPQAARCNASDTYVWLALAANGAAGTIYYPVEFTNISSHSCWLKGFPKVAGITSTDHGVGPIAGHFTGFPAHTVTLKPHQTAHALLGISDNGFIAGCHAATGGGLSVVPPGQKQRQLIFSFTFPACKNAVFMHVYPVAPGIGVP